MRIFRFSFVIVFFLCVRAYGQSGLVAHWTFDDGRGDKLTDHSGNDNHGKIHGAKWVASGEGHVLRFDGVDDYVDCGECESLNLPGPLTLEAWIHPDAALRGEPGIVGKFYESYAVTFYRGAAWCYISGGDNAVKWPLNISKWQHMAFVFDGKSQHIYLNGELVNSKVSKHEQAKPGRNFYIAALFGDPNFSDQALRKTAFFMGKIDDIRVYNRTLTQRQIIDDYNAEAADKGLPIFDSARFGQLVVDTYVYPRRQEVLARVDYKWIKPMPESEKIIVTLTGPEVDETVELDSTDLRDAIEVKFDTRNFDKGTYTVTATIRDRGAQSSFKLPVPAPTVASPEQKVSPPLPVPVTAPDYKISLTPFGGIAVTIDEVTFPIDTIMSYPLGGENGLTVTPRAKSKHEPSWNVNSSTNSDGVSTVTAEGKAYSLHRVVRMTQSRVEVEDTFTNKTDDVLGIILSNQINLRELDGAVPILQSNPTVFAGSRGAGVGVVALDDVYFLQSYNRLYEGLLELRDEHFGLDKGASYTVKWAIYPIASDNYFDFINQVRHDEGINGHAEGGLTLSTGWKPLSHQEVRLKGLGYLSQCYLTRVTSNPMISLEGWEFVEYPLIAKRIEKTMTDSRRKHPDLKIGFHVAHALYTTNDPDKFADSKAILADGSQAMYGPNTMDYYGKYFSKELVEDKWRWWIYLPTMENSFGKYMIKAAETMINDMGANFIWADGWISGYVEGGYVYDRFDGHSVTIDPKTKLVTRKKANVTLVALPVLKTVAQMFDEAGGRLVSNGRAGPPSYWKYNTITSNETGGGDQQPISSMYFGKTVTPLGNPNAIKNFRDIYRDVLSKLDLGALYFWFGEADHRPSSAFDHVTEESLVTYMYPITFDNIQPGIVRGLERIVTNRSGVYGWPRDRSLHNVIYSDSLGRLIPNQFMTTVDSASVRTELLLDHNESVVLEKMPVTVSSSKPVNLLVRQYGKNGVEILANGTSDLEFTFTDGRFPVSKGLMYKVTANNKPTVVRRDTDELRFKIPLTGATKIRVEHFTPSK